MQLCLGTAQFGMNYGVAGGKQPPLDDCIKMLEYAVNKGINSFDTASAYGNAEEVLGVFIKKNVTPRNTLNLISKIKPDVFEDTIPDDYYKIARNNIIESLKKLNTDYLDSYLFHTSRYVFNEAAVESMNQLVKDGLTRNIGVSIYLPEEAIKAVNSYKISSIQIPYNILDKRLDKINFWQSPELGKKNIYARSAFLQGLILMEPQNIPSHLYQAVPYITKLKNLCDKHSISRHRLALKYVESKKNIGYIVFGVDNIEQLKEQIESFNSNIPDEIINEAASYFNDISDDIIIPSRWKKQ